MLNQFPRNVELFFAFQTMAERTEPMGCDDGRTMGVPPVDHPSASNEYRQLPAMGALAVGNLAHQRDTIPRHHR